MLRSIAESKGLADLAKLMREASDFVGEKYPLALEKATKELRDRARDAVDERNKLQVDYGELKYEHQVINQQLSMFKRKLKLSEVSYGDLTRQLINTQKELRGIEAEWDNLKKSYDGAQDYIKSLESQIFEQEQILKHIPKMKIATISQQTKDSERTEQRALHELNSLAINQLKTVRKEAMLDAATLTDIFGTEKTLGIEEEAFQRLYKEGSVQTECETKDQAAGTDPVIPPSKPKPAAAAAAIVPAQHVQQPVPVPIVVQKKPETAEKGSQSENRVLAMGIEVAEESILGKPKSEPREEEAPEDTLPLEEGVSRQQNANSSGTGRSRRRREPSSHRLNDSSSPGSRRTLSRGGKENSPLAVAEQAPAKAEEDEEPATAEPENEKPLEEDANVNNGQNAAPQLPVQQPQRPGTVNPQLVSQGRCPTESLLEKQQEQLQAIRESEAQNLKLLSGMKLQKICPFCKRQRKNPRRPVFNVTPFNIHGIDHMLARRLGILNREDSSTQTESAVIAKAVENNFAAFMSTENPARTQTRRFRRTGSRSEGRSKRKILRDPNAVSESVRAKREEAETKLSLEQRRLRKNERVVRVINVASEYRTPNSSFTGYSAAMTGKASKRLSSLLWKQKHIYDERRKKAFSRGDSPESVTVSSYQHKPQQLSGVSFVKS